jgi:hypothetical protein
MTMTPLEILRTSMRSMHGLLDKAVEDMTLDQLNFRPREGGVSPFFSLWHYVRTEDNIINWVVQRQPTVWIEGGYDVALGLPRTSQGTGMTEAEANAVVLRDLDRWRRYQPAVWQATDAYLGAMDPAEFDARRVTIKPLPEMSLWQGLFGICLSHGYRHIGEIEYARGVIGLGGLTI